MLIPKKRRETFEHLGEWLDEVRENGNPNMEILLVGNKIDKESEYYYW